MSDPFQNRLDARASSLAPSVLRIAHYIDGNRATALASSAQQIAVSTGTSDATVVRAAKALGFTGLGDLKRCLADAMDRPSTPADNMRRTLDETGVGVAEAVAMVLEAHGEALAVLASEVSKQALAAAVRLLHPRERIAIFGIGPSAALARYACVPLGRSGRRTLLLDRTGRMLADQMLDLRAGDGLLALAYGRAYREVVAAVSEARRLGLAVVLMSDDAGHELAGLCDLVLRVPRGRAGRVALHGATLVALEALILGLTSALGDGALAGFDRLNDLRDTVEKRRL